MNKLHYHIIERIRNQASLLSHAPAVRHKNNGKWIDTNWKDFLAEIDVLSRAFLACNINIQDKIAIFANNMPRWTIADYAAMQVRAVTVPIYSTNTAEQVAYILNDADVKILFVGNQTQYDEAMIVTKNCPQLQYIIAMQKEIDLRNHSIAMHWSDFVKDGYPEMQTQLEKRLQEKNMDDLFTLIYTSGTTGNPKGVMLTHANLAHQMEAHDLALQPLGTHDISLAFLPLSHIYERGWQAYMLHRGVVYAYLEDPHTVKDALAEVRPTLMCAVPRFYEKIYSAVMDKVHQAPLLRKLIFYWALRVGKAYFSRNKNLSMPYLLHKQFKLADKLVLSKLRAITGGQIKLMPCGGAKLDPCIAKFFFAIGNNVIAGYGLTETTATVSCSRDNNFNPESIGIPMPKCEVKIGNNNEILVRGGMVMKGYYKNPQATAEAFTEDGFLRTGDAGKLDEQGNLFITDRIKELMKTSTGKYIAPQVLEGKIGKDKFVDQIAVIADAKQYVSALIVPCFETLEAHAKELNIQFRDRKELLKNSEIVKLFEKRIQRLQKELPSFEQVKKFTLLPEAFTMKMNEITPTLKLKRKVILERYKKQIEAMYKP